MLRFLVRRLATAIPTLFCLTVVTFALMTAARGDPALLALQQAGQEPTPELLAAYRTQLGLDAPLPVRYVTWLGRTLTGDLGASFLSHRPVADVVSERIVPTLALGLATLIFSSVVGMALGVVFALRRGTILDLAGRSGAVLLTSVPAFWLSLGLIWLFGEQLHVLPVAGYGSWQSFVLPVVALGVGPAASLMRLTRARLLDVLGEDYIRTARAKGLPERLVALRHALPGALQPAIALLGVRFGHLLAGAIVVEAIFAWPGMGSVLLAAISGRDLPVIGAIVLLAGSLVIVTNLVADTVGRLLDPNSMATAWRV